MYGTSIVYVVVASDANVIVSFLTLQFQYSTVPTIVVLVLW